MHKLFVTIPLVALLSACNTLSDWNLASPFAKRDVATNLPKNTALEIYNFDWQLSGERSIAPMQVFDNGQKTWLQFLPGQNAPAIFGVKNNINNATQTDLESPIYFTRNSDYIILDGVWNKLVFRGGALKAQAQKATTQNNAIGDISLKNNLDSVFDANTNDLTSNAKPEIKNDNQATPITSPKGNTYPINLTENSFAKAKTLFKVSPNDSNIRLALQRWAKQADWTFMPEHWNVDVDIPISAQASFSASFQDSVQELVGATEMAERPLQPCFYSNNVLRVIPFAQSCNRAIRG